MEQRLFETKLWSWAVRGSEQMILCLCRVDFYMCPMTGPLAVHGPLTTGCMTIIRQFRAAAIRAFPLLLQQKFLQSILFLSKFTYESVSSVSSKARCQKLAQFLCKKIDLEEARVVREMLGFDFWNRNFTRQSPCESALGTRLRLALLMLSIRHSPPRNLFPFAEICLKSGSQVHWEIPLSVHSVWAAYVRRLKERSELWE